MTATTLSSRQFNQDTGKAKRASRAGPVFITNRGKPEHVLLSIEQYQALAAPAGSIVDQLGMPGAESVRFTAPRVRNLAKLVDLA